MGYAEEIDILMDEYVDNVVRSEYVPFRKLAVI
jgi:hypothetical protein